jgi:Na+/H+ antiporter NhaD/arsenite permease-like protein
VVPPPLLGAYTVVVAALNSDKFSADLSRFFGSLLLVAVGIMAIPHLSQSRRSQLVQYVVLVIGVLIIFFSPQTLKKLALEIAGYFA